LVDVAVSVGVRVLVGVAVRVADAVIVGVAVKVAVEVGVSVGGKSVALGMKVGVSVRAIGGSTSSVVMSLNTLPTTGPTNAKNAKTIMPNKNDNCVKHPLSIVFPLYDDQRHCNYNVNY
jgi:hypothetical protein